MSTAELAACNCASWEPVNLNDVRLCVSHHRYHRGNKRLASVSQVIRDTWPIKKNFEDADPAVLEHARERGIRVDRYFTEYLNSGKIRIQPGEWAEVHRRTQALVTWWNGKRFSGEILAQIILADDEVAGMPDVIVGGAVLDLKNVSALDQTYWLQVGAYAELYRAQYGKDLTAAGLIHVTEPKDKPVSVRYVEADLDKAIADWKTCRQMWAMVRRRAKIELS